MQMYRVLWSSNAGKGKSKVQGKKFFTEASAEQFFFAKCRELGSLGGMMRRRNKRFRYYDENVHIAKVNF